jgi:hypothetical protein
MDDDREVEIQSEIDALSARIRVQECALLEMLSALPRHNALSMANGLRARMNAWAL